MNNFAPVLIPTLNRHVHFKHCIESLTACTNAEETDLFIAFDYPLKEFHWEGYEIIKDFIPTIKGFKSINVITRNKNFGAKENFYKSIENVFESHDRLIFTEDDNIFSPNFLDFMNQGLEKFKENKNIWGICGYNYPISLPKNMQNNFYYYRGFSAWGFGTWKEKDNGMIYKTEDLKDFINVKTQIKEIKEISNRHYYNILNSIFKKQEKWGDFAVMLNNIKNNQYCVFPTISKVKNHGLDGSGVHCTAIDSDIFLNQKIDDETYFKFTENIPHNYKSYDSLLKDYFSISIKAKIRGFFHHLIYFLFK